MLLNLLRRDLTLHRMVLLAAAALPALFLVIPRTVPEVPRSGMAALLLLLGLFLMALLPIALQLRETRLGTLGDLLTLPVPRRDLVRLRFLEGGLACVAFLTVFLLSWKVCYQLDGTEMLQAVLSPLLLWMLVIFTAYPLPLALRWGSKGVLGALVALIAGLYAWALLIVFGPSRPALAWLFPSLSTLAACQQKFHGAWPQVAAGLAYAVPLLLLAGFYRLALRACERLEA